MCVRECKAALKRLPVPLWFRHGDKTESRMTEWSQPVNHSSPPTLDLKKTGLSRSERKHDLYRKLWAKQLALQSGSRDFISGRCERSSVSRNVHIGSVAHAASCAVVNRGFLLRSKGGRDVKLVTYCYFLLRMRTRGDIHPFPPHAYTAHKIIYHWAKWRKAKWDDNQ